MSERSALALRAVHAHPGCSAWALSVLAPPDGMMIAEWRELLDRELPRLHAAGRVQATTFGVERVRYWPVGFDVPGAAGDVV